MKTCAKCKSTKPLSDFYNQKGHSYNKSSYCKNCFNSKVTQRWIQRKIDAINYKHGKCEDCSLKLQDSHYSVFEFHHLDPSQKELDWNKMKLTSLNAIYSELNKCALLCANCHRIRHANIRDFPDQSKSH
jgi:hypothetical protein